MSKIYKELGKKIRKYRKSKNLTSAEFASILNISAGHLSNIENGTYDIFRLELLFKIAKELNVTLEELLQFECVDLDNVMLDDELQKIITYKSTDIESPDAKVIKKWLNSLAITYLATISKFKSDKNKIESITNHLIDELNLIENIS